MSKDSVPVELPRDLLRQVIAKRGGGTPIDDKRLVAAAENDVPEALREWLGKPKGR